MLHSHHIIAAQNSDFGFINIGDMTEDRFALCGKKIQVKQHCRYLTGSQDVLLSHICSVVIHLVSGKHAMFGKVDTNVLNEIHGAVRMLAWEKMVKKKLF